MFANKSGLGDSSRLVARANELHRLVQSLGCLGPVAALGASASSLAVVCLHLVSEPWGFGTGFRVGKALDFPLWYVYKWLKYVNLRLPYRIDVINVKIMKSMYALTGGVPGNIRVEPKTYSLPGQVSRGNCNLT